MMLRNPWLMPVVIGMLLLSLIGCSGGKTPVSSPAPGGEGKSGASTQAPTQAPKGEKPSSLILATGGTAGTYYPLGGGMANIIKDKVKTNTTAQVTGASVENMRLLEKKEADLAFSQSDIADYAIRGTEMFKEGAVKNLTAIGGLYLETIQIVVAEKSAIQTVADLKDKKVSVGAPGSGTELNAKQILEVHGFGFGDMSTQRLSFGDSAKQIQDGVMDAAFITAGAPTAAVNELAATKGVRILPIEPDKIKQLIAKYPFYAEQVIPAKTYPNQGAEVRTVAVKAIMTARAELDTELVYNITKALYENTSALAAINTKGNEIKTESALEGISIPVHPGAQQYFNEKGVKK